MKITLLQRQLLPTRYSKQQPARSHAFQEQLLRQQSIPSPLRDAYTPSSVMPSLGLEELSVLREQRVTSPVTEEESSIPIFPTDSTAVKLEKLQQIAAESDYTGMSYSEIYTAIWNRYDRAFDGRLSAILSQAGPGPVGWTDIFNQFDEETGKEVFTPLFQDFVDQGLLEEGEWYDRDDTEVMQRLSEIKSAPFSYSGMSFEEKEAAILEKYRGKHSYLDFLSMQGELKNALVYRNKMGRDGESDFFSTLDIQLRYNYVYQNDVVEPSQLRHPNPAVLLSEEQWAHIFREPFDVHRFINNVREAQGTAIFLRDPAFSVLSIVAGQVDGWMDLMDRQDRR